MKLRVVPTKAHAAVDQVVGPALVLAPKVLGLEQSRESLVPRLSGAATAVYGNLTDYELAVKRLLPMKAHLALDAAGGVALGAAPWALGTAKRGRRHWLPHALVGALEVAMALTTKTQPADRHGLDRRLRAGWKLARTPQTWKAIGGAAKTVATSPSLRKAGRQLARVRA